MHAQEARLASVALRDESVRPAEGDREPSTIQFPSDERNRHD